MQNPSRKGRRLEHLDFIIIDIITLALSFVIAYLLKFAPTGFENLNAWSELLVRIILFDLAVILFASPFSGILERQPSEELLNVILQAGYNFLICTIILYVQKSGAVYSRIVLTATYILYALLGLVFRSLWKKLRRIDAKAKRKTIFVVGRRAELPQLIRSINSGFFQNYTVKGVCVVDGAIGEEVKASIDVTDKGQVVEQELVFKSVTDIKNMGEYVLTHDIEEVFVGVAPAEIDGAVYRKLVENGKGVHMNISSMVGFDSDDQHITTVGTYKALSVGIYDFNGKQTTYLFLKRMMDILFGALGMLAVLPMALIVKISYVLSGDMKPIFYTHTRVGLNGKTFKMYKFRSMVPNADALLQEMLKDEKYRAEWEQNQKFEHDPRITKLGGILRKTSLDELPQLINVLRGEMTLIGPRPLVVGELEMHNGLKLYNKVKPGITGWWGCNGRSNTTYEERLELEYYYVKNCSLYLDLLCIIKTAAVLLTRNGAR